MSDQPTSRQALYDRIRQSSKQEVIREEMVRLGFWPATGTSDADVATQMARRGELHRQLSALRTEQSRLRDEEAVLKAIRRQRMKESRERREETKARREAEKKARAEAWKKSQGQDIVYLGEGYSGGLGDKAPDADKLKEHGLPNFEGASQLASAVGLTISELRFLAFGRRTSEVSHYVRFEIPKKTGGTRKISAPMPKLKKAQRWILDNVLSKVSLHDAAHGFVPGRSIVTNAEPHVNKAVVVNLDLSNFFPTVGYPRVWGQFRALGYSKAVSTIFAMLCTEPEIEEIEIDGKTYYVAIGERFLPQGAPTSPAMTNILCRRLDRKLTTLGDKMDFVYTRYADDLTLSSDTTDAQKVGMLLRRVRHLVRTEGFEVHKDKTRVLRKGARQEVTGIVVNDKLSCDRKTLRKFRATLHQIEKDGPTGKHWGAEQLKGSDDYDLFAAVIGYANFVKMVDAQKGGPLVERAKAAAKKHGWVPKKRKRPQPEAPATEAKAEAEASTAESGDKDKKKDGKKKPWWKLW